MIKQLFATLRKRKGALVFGVALIAVGVLGFGVTHHAMMVTSTPEFCSSCHEIGPAYQSWLTSSHRVNDKGVVVKCIDCHLPDPSNFAKFAWSKTYHGAKDVYGHFFGGEYDREHAQKAVRASMPNSRCERCHADLLATGMTRGAMLAHRSVMYPKRPGYEKSCLECHEHLVHKPQAYYQRASAR